MKSKYWIAIFLVATLLIEQVSVVLAADASKQNAVKTLQEMSEHETIDFLISLGVDIPNEKENVYEWGEFAKTAVLRILDNPNYQFAINYDVTLKFAEQIRDAVKKFCGDSLECKSSLQAVMAYSLQWSTKFCPWSSAYTGYNCYCFVLGRTGHSYKPGQLSGAGSWSTSTSVATAANYIVQDLYAVGYTTVNKYTYLPSISSGQTLICYRQGSADFHFMKYIDSSNGWRHKPGNLSQPLKYLYTPSTSMTWYNEYSYNGVDYTWSTTYTSTIYYFVCS